MPWKAAAVSSLLMLLNTRVEKSLVHLRGCDCSGIVQLSLKDPQQQSVTVASALTVNSREIPEGICLGESTGTLIH